MDRSAFSRAWDYVGYAPTSKWLAVFGAAASGASFVLLIILLALFTDLMIDHGQIPTYGDLSEPQQTAFRNQWNEQSASDRSAALEAMSLDDAARKQLTKGVESDDESFANMAIRWKAYVGQLLERRSGEEAANAYRIRAVPNPNSPDGVDPDRVRLGVLPLVVRNGDSAISRVLGFFARWNSWMWRPSNSGHANEPYLVGLLIAAVVIAILRALFVNLMHHCAARATLEAVTRLRRLLYHHTYRLGSLTVSSEGPREAVGLFTREVNAVHDGLYARLTVAVREPIKFLSLMVLALIINVWLALAAFCAAGLVWLIGRQTAIVFRRRGRIGARRAGNQLSLLEESLRIMRLVKGYLMEPFNQGRVERQLSEYEHAQLSRFRGELIYRPLLIFLGTLAASGLLFVGGWMVVHDRLNAANLVVLSITLFAVYFSVDIWLAQRRLIRRAEESAVSLFDFLDRRGEVGQVVGAEFLKAMSKKLELDKVGLREPGTGRMLLDELSLTIPAGQRVAIVGSDDAERHALISLIPRFLDPTSGEVRVDGKNIRWVTLDSLRSQTALVSPRDLIFNDTVANNIGCGDPSFSVPQIIEAAKLVHAHNFIQRLPHGYETRIGDMGHSLSIGEQFRIALARAVLRDPAIMIIEEPREVMDEGTKKMLDDAYTRILPERTVIFLPHRLSTLKSCDRIYVIHNGKLTAEGQHKELLQESELYRHLYYLEYYVLAEQ